MPYINPQQREPFRPIIEEVTAIIADQNDHIRMMEYAAFFTYELIQGYLGTLTTPHSAYNSLQFDKKQKHDMSVAAADAVSIICRKHTDLPAQAGEIHYVIAGVCWGALGMQEDTKEARYGQRAYLRGAIDDISKNLPSIGNLRQHLVLKGVLGDVVDETYRRLTSQYEDAKCEEHGDVWPLRD